MQPYISIITLGVDDLKSSLRFYREGLGLPTKATAGSEAEQTGIVFFDLEGGMKLALYPRDGLAADAGVPLSEPSPAYVTIAHNVGGKTEVDAVMEQARAAGAVITDAAHDRFWGGYSGYFQDPDGHLWEVAWNPFL